MKPMRPSAIPGSQPSRPALASVAAMCLGRAAHLQLVFELLDSHVALQVCPTRQAATAHVNMCKDGAGQHAPPPVIPIHPCPCAARPGSLLLHGHVEDKQAPSQQPTVQAHTCLSVSGVTRVASAKGAGQHAPPTSPSSCKSCARRARPWWSHAGLRMGLTALRAVTQHATRLHAAPCPQLGLRPCAYVQGWGRPACTTPSHPHASLSWRCAPWCAAALPQGAHVEAKAARHICYTTAANKRSSATSRFKASGDEQQINSFNAGCGDATC